MFSYFPPFFLFIWLCVSPCCPESEMHAVMRLGSSTLLHSQHNNAHTCCTPLTPRRHSRGGEWGRNSEGETCKHSAKPHRQCWLSRRITIDIDNGSNKRHKPKYEWRQTFRSFPKIVYNLALFFCFFFCWRGKLSSSTFIRYCSIFMFVSTESRASHREPSGSNDKIRWMNCVSDCRVRPVSPILWYGRNRAKKMFPNRIKFAYMSAGTQSKIGTVVGPRSVDWGARVYDDRMHRANVHNETIYSTPLRVYELCQRGTRVDCHGINLPFDRQLH